MIAVIACPSRSGVACPRRRRVRQPLSEPVRSSICRPYHPLHRPSASLSAGSVTAGRKNGNDPMGVGPSVSGDHGLQTQNLSLSTYFNTLWSPWVSEYHILRHIKRFRVLGIQSLVRPGEGSTSDEPDAARGESEAHDEPATEQSAYRQWTVWR
jgi:hypothetical protein